MTEAKITHAVVLAGGSGTRLRPFTFSLPKPLMPVGDLPIIQILLGQLRRAGVRTVTLAINYLAEVIQAFIGNGERFGLEVRYSWEENPRGTIGPLKDILDLPERFFVMNGDLLTDLDLNVLARHHTECGAEVTIGAFRWTERIAFGVLETAPSGQLVGFREKPVESFLVSMGVYVCERSVLDLIPSVGLYGFDRFMLDMLKANRQVQTYVYDGFWMDIGRPSDYNRANEEFDTFREKVIGPAATT